MTISSPFALFARMKKQWRHGWLNAVIACVATDVWNSCTGAKTGVLCAVSSWLSASSEGCRGLARNLEAMPTGVLTAMTSVLTCVGRDLMPVAPTNGTRRMNCSIRLTHK
jgi:hypothetical protein